jgi:hypothetical protein
MSEKFFIVRSDSQGGNGIFREYVSYDDALAAAQNYVRSNVLRSYYIAKAVALVSVMPAPVTVIQL